MQEFVTIPTDLIRQSKRGSPFSETDAIMDILTMADEKGEFYSTVRELSDRWKWSSKKTFSFINNLEDGNILETQKKHKRNTLYRINTVLFNSSQDTNKTQTKHKQDTKEQDKKQKKEEDTEIYKRIIEHLNMVCGTNYRHNTESSRKDIRARLNEGYKEDDFYIVIDKKAKEWTGTEQEKYLRPMTLFGTKFESYLNQMIVNGNNNKSYCQGKIDWDNV